MGFLTDTELASLGLRRYGSNVLISDKCSLYGVGDIEVGDNIRIDDFCVLSGRITLGNNIHVAVGCTLIGGDAGIEVGDFATTSFGTCVFAKSDDYSGTSMTNPTIPDKFKEVISAPVAIGRHVVVGARSVVFPGVTIAEGCSVGAMSLVNKSTEPWGVYVGVPATRLKDRKRDLLALEQAYLRESAHE